jgi:hypothetical protein
MGWGRGDIKLSASGRFPVADTSFLIEVPNAQRVRIIIAVATFFSNAHEQSGTRGAPAVLMLYSGSACQPDLIWCKIFSEF